jgi:signal transduction histidine kinase
VATRLVALFAVASITGLVFGGLRIANAVDTSDVYSRTAQLATLGQHMTVLAADLENERDLASGVDAYQVVAGTAPAGVSASVLGKVTSALAAEKKQLNAAQQTTDSDAAKTLPLAQAIGSSFPSSTQNDAASVVSMINGLGALRLRIAEQTAGTAIGEYSAAVGTLFALNDQITAGSGDPLLDQQVRTLGALSRAKDQASQQQAILYSALIEAASYNAGTSGNPSNTITPSITLPAPEPLNDAGGLGALATAEGSEATDLTTFSNSKTPDLPTIENLASPDQEVNTQLIESWVTSVGDPRVAFEVINQSPTPLYPRSTVVDTWNTDMAGIVATMRGIETMSTNDIVARTQLLQTDAANSALLTAIVTVGAVLLVFLATALVGRSLVNPLRRLRTDALDIAAVRLPTRVAAAATSTEADPVTDPIEPIGVSSTDEIGQVARAFDQVHAEAVRLAGNEAQLRGSLSAMFISLSRRSVPLIDRLARMIDGMEQNEDDPDQLGNLFAMDHLVTRMRRNSENLLVLAGEEPVRKWSESVPLADVVRAAVAEIEQYNRVALTVQPGVMVSGQAVADVVHLLAELIENATLFSPQTTQVRVTVMELSSGGVLVEVRDEGVGVSQTRMADMNWRLENLPALDVSVSRHMGLYAVAHLAARHGIRVKLRPGVPQGLSALVWLPGSLARHERPATPSYARAVGAVPSSSQVTAGRPPTMTAREGSRRPGGASAEPRVRDRGSRSGKSTAWFAAKRPSNGSAGPHEQFTSDWQPATGGRVPGVGPVPAGYEPTAATSLDDLSTERTSVGLPRRTRRTGSYPGADEPGYGRAAQETPLLGAPADGPGGGSPAGPAPAGYADPFQNGGPYHETSRQESLYQQAPPQEMQYPAAEPPEVPAPGQLPTRRRSPEAVRDRLTGFQLGNRDVSAAGPRQEAPSPPALPSAAPPESAPPGPLPTRRRSPEAVRDRLTGFQLGNRDALQAGPEPRQAPPAGEENVR